MTAITYVIAVKQIVLDPNTASVLTVNVKRLTTPNWTCKFLKNLYIKYITVRSPTKIENKIATIEFGHPASNSFVSELLVRLTKEFDKVGKNDDVSVIVLKSEGERAFCAGASFDELVAVSNLEEGKAFFSGFANIIKKLF